MAKENPLNVILCEDCTKCVREVKSIDEDINAAVMTEFAKLNRQYKRDLTKIIIRQSYIIQSYKKSQEKYEATICGLEKQKQSLLEALTILKEENKSLKQSWVDSERNRIDLECAMPSPELVLTPELEGFLNYMVGKELMVWKTPLNGEATAKAIHEYIMMRYGKIQNSNG